MDEIIPQNQITPNLERGTIVESKLNNRGSNTLFSVKLYQLVCIVVSICGMRERNKRQRR